MSIITIGNFLYITHRITLITRLLHRKSHEKGNWKGYLPFPSLPLPAVTLGGQPAGHSLPTLPALQVSPYLGNYLAPILGTALAVIPGPARVELYHGPLWVQGREDSTKQAVQVHSKKQWFMHVTDHLPGLNPTVCGDVHMVRPCSQTQIIRRAYLCLKIQTRTKLRVQCPAALMGTLSERLPKCFIVYRKTWVIIATSALDTEPISPQRCRMLTVPSMI